MLHTHVRTHNRWQRHHPISQRNKSKAIDLLLGLLVVALVATFVAAWWTMRAPTTSALSNNPSNALSGNASSVAPNISFDQNARNLAAANTPEAFQLLIRSLKLGEPSSQRSIVLTALKDASPAVVPELMLALDDPDAGVRSGATQVLGMRRDYQAIAAIIDMTRNSDDDVRLQSVLALGALDAWQALPRLQQLLVIDSNSGVRQAALGAIESFRKEIAQSIGLPAPELRDISVTSSDVPQVYAVTSNDLYAQHGTAWTQVSRLPDAPLAIATGGDSNLIYLSTLSSGLYRSVDGGKNWEHVQFGSQTATGLTVTAIVIDPQNSRQVYVALASPGATAGIKDPLGISASSDGGATWWQLEDSLIDLVSTRLVIDPQWQGYIYGTTQDDTQWRYSLPLANSVAVDQANGGDVAK
jgi:hypothetical protein